MTQLSMQTGSRPPNTAYHSHTHTHEHTRENELDAQSTWQFCFLTHSLEHCQRLDLQSLGRREEVKGHFADHILGEQKRLQGYQIKQRV